MAQITITVPDAHIARINDAFAAQFGYTGTAPDGTPETKANHTRRKIREFAVNIVASYESQQAALAATAQANTDLG